MVRLASPLPARSSGHLVRVEIDYSLTLFRSVAKDWIADVGDDQLLGGFARCTTRPAQTGGAVQMSCWSTHPWSGCIAGYHTQSQTGKNQWGFGSCEPIDYAPFAGGLWRDAYFRLGWFGTGQGLPAAGAGRNASGEPANLIEALVSEDHFTRRVVIPQLQVP